MKDIKLTKEERNILASVERGEFRSVRDLERVKSNVVAAAHNTLGKTKSINIRISEKDLHKIKALAVEKGLPYQTLISSLLHQFSNKREGAGCFVVRDRGKSNYRA